MTFSFDTNALIDKVAALLPALEARGTLYFFALAEREDVDRWDVVISSEWSDRDSAAAVRFVADYMRPRFKPQELTLISRIAVIASSDPKVHELTNHRGKIVPKDNVAVPSGRIYEKIENELLGSDVRLAFIFKSQPVPAAVPGGPLIGAGAQP